MKKVKLTLAAGILFLGLQMMAQNYTPGVKLYHMDQYNKAKKALLAEVTNPANVNSWFYLGKIYLEQGKTDSARSCFNSLATANPKSVLSTIGLALVDAKSGNKAQALSALDKALKPAKSAKDITALDELAMARYQAGDTASWRVPLDAALAVSGAKKSPDIFIMYGDIYSKLGELYPDRNYHGKAATQYQQAIYFDDSNLEARSKLAELYLRGMNYGLGEQIINEILTKDSTYVPGLKQAGEYYYSVGKYPQAIYYYRKYINSVEPNSKDLGRYATFLFFNKQYGEVADNVNKVMTREPDNAVMLRLKGYSAYETGKFDEGLDAMTKFFNLRSGKDDKKIAQDYEYYGKLQLKTGHEAEGVENLKAAIGMDASMSYLYEDIAKYYDSQNKYLEAADAYDKFIAANEKGLGGKRTSMSGLYFRKGSALLSYVRSIAGTPDSAQTVPYLWKADSAFAKVSELSPSSHIGFYMRAQINALIDKDSKQGLAKPYYEQALTLAEANPTKYKDVIIQSAWYLGSYYYNKWDEAKTAGDTANIELYKTQSLGYWNKVLALDPQQAAANAALTELNK